LRDVTRGSKGQCGSRMDSAMVENDEPGHCDLDNRETAPAKTWRSRLSRTTFVFGAGVIILLWAAFLFLLAIKMVNWITAIV